MASTAPTICANVCDAPGSLPLAEGCRRSTRYFEVSLFLLVTTGVLAVVSTGKLDPISTFAPLAALIYKGIRVWRGRGPELSARVATWLVLAYFLFFPLDLWVFSRESGRGRAESAALRRTALCDPLAAVRHAGPPVFGAHEPRLRLSRGPRGHVDAGFGDPHGRDGLSRRARRFPGAVGFDVRGARNSPQRRRSRFTAFEAGSPVAQQIESRARRHVDSGRRSACWPSASCSFS